MTIKYFRRLQKGLALLACSVSACLFADNSNKEIVNTDLPYAIYIYGSKNFTATDSNGDVVVSENLLYDFDKMKLYADVFLHTSNYHDAGVFKEISNHFENPDKFFERTIAKNKYFGESDEDLKDYLRGWHR